ncbi:MAG: BrnT family toxin [Nitrospirae bacterium]|nr:BrnT family toxin [Nitrospirota bacterium]
MTIKGIIWFDDIVEKLQRKHGVQQHEAVDVLNDGPSIRFVEKGHKKDENVYAAAGRTAGGRYLIVFFVHKSDGYALIISARDMTAGERKRHGQG